MVRRPSATPGRAGEEQEEEEGWEAVRRIYIILCILALTLGAAITYAQPVTYPTTPPAWYDPTLEPGTILLFFPNFTALPDNGLVAGDVISYNYTIRPGYNFTGDFLVTITAYSTNLEIGVNSSYALKLSWGANYLYLYDAAGSHNLGAYDKNAFHNYLIVFHSSTFDLYIDGVLQGSFTYAVAPPFNNITFYVIPSATGGINYTNTRIVYGVYTIKTTLTQIVTVNTTLAIARAPAGNAFISTNASQAWLDEAYINASGTYAFAWAPYFKILSNATAWYGGEAYNITAPAYAAPLPDKITCSGVVVEPVFPGDVISCAPQDNTVNVTFTVRQYGTNYTALQVSTPGGRIVGRRPLDSLGQATVPLTPYNTYYVYFMAPGETRLYGALTVSQTAYIFDVLPAPPPQPSGGNVTAWWDGPLLRVAGTCPSPPCRLIITKHYINGSSVVAANLTITAQVFSVALNLSDPWTTVDVYTASGNLLGRSYAGGTQLLNNTQLAAARNFTALLARYMSPTRDAAFLAAMGAVLVFLAFTTVGSLLTGGIALAAYLAVVGPVMGYYPLGAGGAVLLIALLALHYISKRVST